MPLQQKTNLPDVTLATRALRLLARREYTRKELAQKLSAYVETAEQLEALLDDLVKQGFLSDARFAQGFVRSRSSRLGSRRIERELRDKGIADEIARQTVCASGLDDFATASALRERKFGALPTEEKEKARQVRFLQARGFSLDVIFKVLRRKEA